MYLFTCTLTPLMGLRGFCSGLVLPGPACLNSPNDQGRQRWWAPCFLAPEGVEERGTSGSFCNLLLGKFGSSPWWDWKLPKVVLKRQSQGERLTWRKPQNLRSRASWVLGCSRRQASAVAWNPSGTGRGKYAHGTLAVRMLRPGWGQVQARQGQVTGRTKGTQLHKRADFGVTEYRGDLLYIINYVPIDCVLPDDDNTIYNTPLSTPTASIRQYPFSSRGPSPAAGSPST